MTQANLANKFEERVRFFEASVRHSKFQAGFPAAVMAGQILFLRVDDATEAATYHFLAWVSIVVAAYALAVLSLIVRKHAGCVAQIRFALAFPNQEFRSPFGTRKRKNEVLESLAQYERSFAGAFQAVFFGAPNRNPSTVSRFQDQIAAMSMRVVVAQSALLALTTVFLLLLIEEKYGVTIVGP